MEKINVKTISSLEKVLPLREISVTELTGASCLIKERFSYQIALLGAPSFQMAKRLNIVISSDLKEKIKIYEIGNVPVNMPAYSNQCDNRYITREASVIPDVLTESDGTISVSGNAYRSIWVEVDADTNPGMHEIKISFEDDEGIYGESVLALKVVAAELPKQSFIFTQWFHSDCISSYYGFEPLSENHWDYIEKFIKMAVSNGINMILTPIFTLPLDTKIGGERPTVQLVDVRYENGKYTFTFDKLLRWIDICRRAGVEFLEISHLFSQWGAKYSPKIEVAENGKRIKKFGWHTPSESEEYKDFLAQFLPELTAVIGENWDSSKVYFHLSDEPPADRIESYGEIYKFIKPYILNFNLMDAMSDYEIYKKGYIDTPVSTIGKINDFIEKGVDNLWGYYCCGEGDRNLSNRFISMPSYRNRIIGIQLYKYGIKGFLHWGYNFYYSQYSTKLINPFITNDSDGGFPSGDAFSVYPGKNGPLASLRLFVFYEALQDMRALKVLEDLIGKEEVVELIDRCGEITFNDYPDSAEYIINLRQTVNDLIDENIKKL